MTHTATRVGIIGASSYGAAELLRLLGFHPRFEIAYIASDSGGGKSLGAVFPQFRGVIDREFQTFNLEIAIDSADLFFLPVKNGLAMKMAQALLDAGKKVVDFSADFRLKDPAQYETTYGIVHSCPELLHEAVYGLVELNRESIRNARLVANPGCYPTAAILSILPLLSSSRAAGTDTRSIIVDAYSGVSGAGRSSFSLDYHFPEVNESLTAYKVLGHRHTREIEQAAADQLGHPISLTFTPHLAPITRGILSTTYITLTREASAESLREEYEQYYSQERFVVILPAGEQPRTGSVRGSNYVQISVNYDERVKRATIVAAVDNLTKGMSGQAIQAMNVMCGHPEECGLESSGICP